MYHELFSSIKYISLWVNGNTSFFWWLSCIFGAFTFSSASLTSAIYRHYMFDINMFTHLNLQTGQAFTDGEKVTGGTSGARGRIIALPTATTMILAEQTGRFENNEQLWNFVTDMPFV